MIIALPPTDHDHLADALVRDLGFTRAHVDQPLRDLLVALDPFVDSGVSMANRGPTPRLSSKLEQMGGNSDEERWTRLLNPSRPGAAVDRTAAEVRRLLDALRERDVEPVYHHGDTVIVGVGSSATLRQHLRPSSSDVPFRWVAIQGRSDAQGVDHWIEPAGVVGEQEAIVNYVRGLREPKPTTFTQEYAVVDDDGKITECGVRDVENPLA